MSTGIGPSGSLPPAVTAWVQDILGVPVTAFARLTGGNRRQAWLVQANTPAHRYFLRIDPGQAVDSEDPYSLEREADVYRALAGTEVRIASLLAAGGPAHALLVDLVPGDASYRSASTADRGSLADDLADQLATLHALDPGRLQLGALGPVASVRDHICRELVAWTGMYRATGRSDPLAEAALSWLSANVPGAAERSVLVHGDAGPGNFLHSGGKITALIDWEFAHLGDRHEDLAWVSMRDVLEPLPSFPDFVRRYQRRSGLPVDPVRLRYHRVLVQLRVVVVRLRDEGISANGDLANSLISRALNRRLLLEALTDAMGLPLPAVAEPAAQPLPDDLGRILDVLLDDLRTEVLPALAEPRARAKVKSIARLVKYLIAGVRYRPGFAAAQLAGLARVLGHQPVDIASGTAALAEKLRTGELAIPEVVEWFVAESRRDTIPMAASMGALATRHLADLSFLDTAVVAQPADRSAARERG